MIERLCLGCMRKCDDSLEKCPYCGSPKNPAPEKEFFLVPGTVLAGRYAVGRCLGCGGFGITYLGYDLMIEKKIAIKEYYPTQYASREKKFSSVVQHSGNQGELYKKGIENFILEARALAKFIGTKGIVPVYNVFEENNTAYIIMEYLEGESLRDYLKRIGKISIDEAVQITVDILEALDRLHKIKMIHRDIAPDNVFRTSEGEIVLIDFGAARLVDQDNKTLTVVLKHGFAPPEQYRSDGNQGPWTDIYACAATLYVMITGNLPEQSTDRVEKDDLLPPSKLGIQIPANVETALMNALNLSVEKRTPSAKKFIEELIGGEKVVRVEDTRPAVKGSFEKRFPVGLKLVLGLAVLTLITIPMLIFSGIISNPFEKKIINSLVDDETLRMPNVVNDDLKTAGEKLTALGLVMQVSDKLNSDEIPENLVLKQSVEFGTIVVDNMLVELIVSAGKKLVYISNYAGMYAEKVEDILKGSGLSVELVYEESESVSPGSVIRLELAENDGEPGKILQEEDVVEANSRIIIVVSNGRSDIDDNEMTVVPDFAGLTWEEATQKASQAGLYLSITSSEFSSTVPKNIVMSQNVKAGEEIKQGSSVGLVISLGIETVRVPDVQYKSKDEAARLLSEAGLVAVFEIEENETVSKDHAIRQDVKAGTLVNPGSKVVVYLSAGSERAEKAVVVTRTAENGIDNTEQPAGVTSITVTGGNLPIPTSTPTITPVVLPGGITVTPTATPVVTIPTITHSVTPTSGGTTVIPVTGSLPHADEISNTPTNTPTPKTADPWAWNPTATPTPKPSEEYVIIPNVLGKTEAEAVAMFKSKGIVPVVEYYSYSSSSSYWSATTIEDGKVCEQENQTPEWVANIINQGWSNPAEYSGYLAKKGDSIKLAIINNSPGTPSEYRCRYKEAGKPSIVKKRVVTIDELSTLEQNTDDEDCRRRGPSELDSAVSYSEWQEFPLGSDMNENMNKAMQYESNQRYLHFAGVQSKYYLGNEEVLMESSLQNTVHEAMNYNLDKIYYRYKYQAEYFYCLVIKYGAWKYSNTIPQNEDIMYTGTIDNTDYTLHESYSKYKIEVLDNTYKYPDISKLSFTPLNKY